MISLFLVKRLFLFWLLQLFLINYSLLIVKTIFVAQKNYNGTQTKQTHLLLRPGNYGY